ncbi:MAG: MtrB/PioB family outer membrane beta-barrel protein, partial [Bacteroidota bacterium]
MNMNKSIGSITATLLSAALAVQSPAQEQVSTSGEYRPGIRWTTLDVNSSKYDEYRDLRDGFFVNTFRLDILAPEGGWLFDLGAEKALRDDQRVRVRLDHLDSRLSIFIDHNKTPHNLSNKAMTPYIDRGRGLFTVPAPTSILKDGNDTTGTPSLVPTNGQMAFNDALIGKYLETYLRPVSQRTDRERTTAGLSLHDVGPFNFSLTYQNERRNGMRSTFGPIGDRPPRTLNVQIPEPVKYTTYEMMGDIGYTAPRFQLQLRYVLSIFENEIDVLRWENMFFAPDPGMDFVATVAGTPRNVSNF